MLISSRRSPGLPTTSVLGYQLEIPKIPTLGLINWLEQLTELREILLILTSFLKDMIKNMDKQPDEDIHKARFGRVPRAEASFPKELASVTLSVRGCVHQPESCLGPIGMLWRFPHTGMINY